MTTRRHWVIVASRDHATRGLNGGFVMANHGKRSPLARMSPGDGVFIYSPTTAYPQGEPLRAVTIVGEVIGDEPEPSDVITGGFRRAASLREIEPLPLEQIRQHLPVSRIRFGFFELDRRTPKPFGRSCRMKSREQGPATSNACRMRQRLPSLKESRVRIGDRSAIVCGGSVSRPG